MLAMGICLEVAYACIDHPRVSKRTVRSDEVNTLSIVRVFYKQRTCSAYRWCSDVQPGLDRSELGKYSWQLVGTLCMFNSRLVLRHEKLPCS